jgi:hypothetical protein
MAVAHCWMSFANAVSLSHHPAQARSAGHGEFSAGAHQHGHRHDQPLSGEDRGMPASEHHGTDHSHDKPNLPASVGLAALHLPDYLHGIEHDLVDDPPHYPFERPPRPLPLN